jgi:hypothetical protein
VALSCFQVNGDLVANHAMSKQYPLNPPWGPPTTYEVRVQPAAVSTPPTVYTFHLHHTSLPPPPPTPPPPPLPMVYDPVTGMMKPGQMEKPPKPPKSKRGGRKLV